MKYPNDASGDTLRRMQEAGDDLTRSRNVDFTVVFPDEQSAEQFANHFRVLGYEATVELTESNEQFPWDVVVIKHMIPTYEEIGAFEESLQEAAISFGGYNDGWGCLSESQEKSR